MLTNLHYEPLVKLVTQPLKSPCFHHYYYHLGQLCLINQTQDTIMLKDLHYEPTVKLVTQPLNFHAFTTLITT